MPYSGADDSNLPANVKKLSSKKRRQWVSVWNSSYKKCQGEGGKDCESSAFAQANGVVGRKAEKGVYVADDGQLNLYIPITKKDKAQQIVGGYVSSGDVDLDGQIVDQDWLKSVLPPWMADWGNIREQHDPTKAVGRAKSVDLETEPGPFMTAKIVDKDAWAKVEEGVYNGLSVGIKKPIIVSDPKAVRGRIIGGTLVEVSIVDRPANDAAKLVLVKSGAPGEWTDVQSGITIARNGEPEPEIEEGKVAKEAELATKATDDKPEDKPAEKPADKPTETPADAPMDEEQHPFEGDHSHAHMKTYGSGSHFHAHKHEGDDFHEHQHCTMCGKDARVCACEGGARTWSAGLEEKVGDKTEVKSEIKTDVTDTTDKAAAGFQENDAAKPSRPGKLGDVEALLKEIMARVSALAHDTADQVAETGEKSESSEFQSQTGSGASISPPKLEATFAVTPDMIKAIIGDAGFQAAVKLEAERLASDTLLTKAAAADTLSTVADVSKLAGGLAKGLGLLADQAEASATELKALKATVAEQQVDLEQVKEMAAPPKGVGYAVEKGLLLEPDKFVGAMKAGGSEAGTAITTLAPLLASMNEDQRRAFATEILKATTGAK